jgi:hypothetical protein
MCKFWGVRQQDAFEEHAGIPNRHLVVFVLIGSPRAQDWQANTDPLPLPHGEKLEASGCMSTRYSILHVPVGAPQSER